jgi:ATP-dependent exoDNAse (exonuclease V) alpha subunit
VHKAQGSQFANVIMPVTQSFNFDRTMLYTGLT